MTLAVRVWWPDGVYDAARLDPSRPEWPPSPGRVFAALRAGARSDDQLAALRWLETQDPPRIHADRQGMDTRRHAGYVVVNAVQSGGGSLSHPGRDSGLRVRVGTTLTNPEATFVWPEASPGTLVVECLDKLAAQVGYLGRSTSHVVISVEEAWDGSERPAWVPVQLGHGQAVLPVPYPGLLDQLDAAYVSGERACDTYRTRDYRFDDGTATETVPIRTLESPYSAPFVLRFAEGIQLAGSLLGPMTAALRRAVLAIVPDPVPTAISGHGADGLPHVGYFGLVDVSHRHADGHILALAVVSPRREPSTADALANALLIDPGLRRLSVPGLGAFELTYDPVQDRPRGATAERWVRPSRTWTTATPAVLDRYPRRRLTESDVVAQGLVAAGYPAPVSVEVASVPFVTGGLMLRRHQVPQRPGDTRPVRHIRVEFEHRIDGPVVIGALRHVGFGLCVPTPDGAGRSAADT